MPQGRKRIITLIRDNIDERARLIYKWQSNGNIIILGTSLEENDELVEVFRSIFIIAIFLMLICGSLLGGLLARSAMSGVDRITKIANQISEENISARVMVGKEGIEIERLASAFNAMLDRIESLVNEVRDFSNNMAHDLRSPITSIRGTAETTLTGTQDIREYREMAVTIIEQSDRLVGLINTIIEIARTEARISEQIKESINLTELVKSAYDLFLPVAEDAGVELVLRTVDEGLMVSGDKMQIQRAVANLLDNAIKFTAEGGRVVLECDREAESIFVLVKDNGLGIDKNDIPNIFNRFYRVDQSRTGPGYGLGLSFVKLAVKSNDGHLDVDSALGKGSSFKIIFPT